MRSRSSEHSCNRKWNTRVSGVPSLEGTSVKCIVSLLQSPCNINAKRVFLNVFVLQRLNMSKWGVFCREGTSVLYLWDRICSSERWCFWKRYSRVKQGRFISVKAGRPSVIRFVRFADGWGLCDDNGNVSVTLRNEKCRTAILDSSADSRQSLLGDTESYKHVIERPVFFFFPCSRFSFQHVKHGTLSLDAQLCRQKTPEIQVGHL